MMQPLVSAVANETLNRQQTPLGERVSFLLSLLDIATQHVAARVAVLHLLQGMSPPQFNEQGDPVLESWGESLCTKWLVESSQWDPVNLEPMADGAGFCVVVGDEIFQALKGLMQTAAPVEGLQDGQLVAGFCAPSLLPGTSLYLGLFNGPFGPYLEAFAYPWPDGEVPISSRPLLGTLDTEMELTGLQVPVKLKVVANPSVHPAAPTPPAVQ